MINNPYISKDDKPKKPGDVYPLEWDEKEEETVEEKFSDEFSKNIEKKLGVKIHRPNLN